ncbi:hypothetical protein EMCRGX_G033061 [Ephydatia muelleri]
MRKRQFLSGTLSAVPQSSETSQGQSRNTLKSQFLRKYREFWRIFPLILETRYAYNSVVMVLNCQELVQSLFCPSLFWFHKVDTYLDLEALLN